MPTRLRDAYQERYGIKQPLRGYQRRACKHGVQRDAFGLFMDPRLGKTRIDIAVSGYRFLQQDLDKWIIIAPSIALDVWRTELQDTLAIPHEVVIVEGKAEERKLVLKGWKAIPGKLAILIINHEATWRLKKFLYKALRDHRRGSKVTIDESQKIKNHSAKQSSACHTLGTRADYRTIMTGTPGGPLALFSQFKFLEPKVFGTKWKKNKRFGDEGPDGFLDHYVATYGFGGYKPKTLKNLDELEEKVDQYAFKLTREQAGGFPKEFYETKYFDLTGAARKHYDRMERELKTIVNGEEVRAKIILTQVLRCQQITGGFLPVRSPDDDQATNVAVGDDRIRALRGILEEYDEREPIVLYARFRYEIEAMLSLMRRVGRTATFIRGGMKPQDRDRAKWDFMNGKFNTCVVQIKAAGIAIDLSRADTSIFYSMTSSFIDYEQAKARTIARTGGKKVILTLAARNTVDDDIIAVNQERAELHDRIMGRFRDG